MEEQRAWWPRLLRRALVPVSTVLMAVAAVWIFFLWEPGAGPAPDEPPAMPDAAPREATPTPTAVVETPPPCVGDDCAGDGVGDAEAEPPPFEQCLDHVCEHTFLLPAPQNVELRLVDDSQTLNWYTPTEACLWDMTVFLEGQSIRMDGYSFTLRDQRPDEGTEVSWQWPPSADPVNSPGPNEVAAACTLDPQTVWEADCHVRVVRYRTPPDEELRLSVTLALMDAVRRLHHEAFVDDLAGFYHEGDPLLFAPLVQAAEDEMRSSCWNVLEAAGKDEGA